ncbi:hypothetical protein [Reticulibacter mediterranei]|uniref:hypothetical protein n=1 Tax=Reticulibacter mediterranei TaxID=2778369 RepID=UPI001C68C244|nr:hypothetical protein [Reticulibacter mediterranei]
MRGYLLFHFHRKVQGYATDYFQYDPFIWHNPYILSFCHMNMITGRYIQKCNHPSDIVILGVTRVGGQFCCSLVFYIGDKRPLSVARATFPFAKHHFVKGEKGHYAYYHAVPEHFSLIADMDRSYIPQPAVPIEDMVNAERQRLYPKRYRPLSQSWKKRRGWIRLDPIDRLLTYVDNHAKYKHYGALPFSPLPV